MLRCAVALKKFRPSATTVLAAAVLALLPVLATAQYRWLGQISENERGRLQRALLNAMSGVARDLDNEVAGAVGQLDVEGLLSGRVPAAGDATAVTRTGAPASRPVREVWYIQRPGGHDANLILTRCDVSAWSCAAAEWPAEFADLSREIARVVRDGSSHGAERLSRIVRTAHGGQSVIVLPLGEGSGYHGRRRDDTGERDAHNHGSGAAGVALLLLNDQWLRGERVPLSLIHISEPTRPY